MTTPAVYNFTVTRGSRGANNGLVFRLQTNNDGVLENIPYEDIRLSIYNGSTLLLRASLSNGGLVVLSEPLNQFAWVPTAADTRLIPNGDVARYELEVWNGDYETVYLYGTIKGVGGLNDDAVTP